MKEKELSLSCIGMKFNFHCKILTGQVSFSKKFSFFQSLVGCGCIIIIQKIVDFLSL